MRVQKRIVCIKHTHTHEHIRPTISTNVCVLFPLSLSLSLVANSLIPHAHATGPKTNNIGAPLSQLPRQHCARMATAY